jgi:hypothetical protein
LVLSEVADLLIFALYQEKDKGSGTVLVIFEDHQACLLLIRKVLGKLNLTGYFRGDPRFGPLVIFGMRVQFAAVGGIVGSGFQCDAVLVLVESSKVVYGSWLNTEVRTRFKSGSGNRIEYLI